MALTAERKKTRQQGLDSLPPVREYPIAANVKAYAGGIAVLSGGYAAPGTTALNLIAIGRFEETVDNLGGAAGAKTVKVRRGEFRWDNSTAGDLIAQANVGADCFIVDDERVALTSGSNTRSRAGKIAAVDSDGVFVQIGLGV